MPPSSPESTSDATPAPEPSPAAIGRYQILERIGAGGMGTVYKAHDPHLDRCVALKLPRIDPTLEDRAKRVERFQREARSAAQVWHPHVCPIYDVGEQDGQPYVVMAYVEGQSLARRLSERGRFEDVGEAVTLICQVLEALEAVHAHGIIHRDLKPSNIMLDRSSRAVLTDFGLARLEKEAGHLTSEGMVVGTPSYMAPEQAAAQTEKIGPCTDLYSVGVVFFEMLTGRLPFEGPPLLVLGKIVHEPPPALAALRPYLDARLEALLRKALAKEPRERFQNARQFIDALRELTHTSPPLPAGVQPTAPRPELPQQERFPSTARASSQFPDRELLIPSLFSTVLFTLGGLSLVLGLQSKDHESSGRLLGAAMVLVILSGLPWLIRVFRREALFSKNTMGQTSLMGAAKLGQVSLVRNLLARGAEVNEKDEEGRTALGFAAANGHIAVVRLLLDHGTEVNDKDNQGRTPLTVAEARGHANVVELLRQFGAREPLATPHPTRLPGSSSS
jgi:serine/threonine protein kinase